MPDWTARRTIPFVQQDLWHVQGTPPMEWCYLCVKYKNHMYPVTDVSARHVHYIPLSLPFPGGADLRFDQINGGAASSSSSSSSSSSFRGESDSDDEPGQEPVDSRRATDCCPTGHALVPYITTGTHISCDVCNASQQRGARMRSCRGCDYDVCSACATRNSEGEHDPDAQLSVSGRALTLSDSDDY